MLALVGLVVGASPTQAVGSTNLVISQVYGGGGNTGATLKNDFIEIFNRGTTDVPLAGYSVQYGASAGNIGPNAGQITPLSGSVEAGQYVLVQEAQGAGGTTGLAADITDDTPIAMSGTAGKVVLVSSATGLNCGAAATPCSAAALAPVVDLVGYGGAANQFEGSGPTAGTANTTAALRNAGGCTDTDSNAADFTVDAPNPRNRLTARHSCDTATTSPTISVGTSPLNPTPGSSVTIAATATPGTNPTSTNLSVNCDLSWAGLTASSALFDDGTNGDVTAGDLTFTRQFTIPSSTVPGMRNADCHVSDEQGRSGTTPYAVNVSPGTTDVAPTVSSHTPTAGEANVAADANIGVVFSEPVTLTDGWYTIVCATSGAHAASVSGASTNFTLDPAANFSAGESCTATIVAAHVTDQDTDDPPDNLTEDVSWTFTIAVPPVAIHDIQGSAHISPKAGQTVANVRGIVTARRSNGFYMQDPNPDLDSATSEGIFVFTSSAPTVSVGDAVSVNGRVQEFRPGGAASSNLTTTELVSPTTTVLSSGNPLPPTTVLGTAGRIPPNQVIEDDASGDVETSGTFDPNSDGIDFYESVEGMRVQLDDAVAVGPTNSFGETPIVGDNGANAGVRTSRGGVLLRQNDGNPERVVADDALVPLPKLNVGDGYTGPIVGVMDYNFGNWFVEVTSSVGRVDNGLQREVTDAPGPNQLSVGTFNFENLDTGDPQSKFDQLAGIIVNNLRSPDIVAGEEVQDNNGPTDNGVVDASQTLTQLVSAIQAAGGPTYQWREIDPVNDQDGGEPGGNIRQVFLFRTDRGVSFVDRPGGTSTNATGVTGSGASTQLTFSPGRIDPANTAWNSSRKPLAGEFMFRGSHVFAIVNHFNSKGGDDALFGHLQPPNRSSETQRHQQAHLVADFVSALTTADPSANVVVLGDLNDFEFSQTVGILETAGMHDLMGSLPLNQRYSYEFEGNAQVLDHIMFSGGLFGRPFVFDPVHVNAEFWDQASDHDPSVVRVTLNEPPTVAAGGPYSVAEGGTVPLSAAGSDPEGGPLTYAWDLDDNGTFETSGASPTFSAAALDGPSARTVHVQVTDNGGLTATADATVNVTNVAPTASFSAPASVFAGSPFTTALTSPQDPSAADVGAGFTYSFDCGSGYGAFGASSTASCPTSDTGTRSVGGKIRDKDGGVTEYRRTVDVVVTFTSLCQLVKAYTSDAQLISQLCQRLDQAEKAPNATAKNAHLASFRDQVDKSGAFTPVQAETLKRLSLRL